RSFGDAGHINGTSINIKLSKSLFGEGIGRQDSIGRQRPAISRSESFFALSSIPFSTLSVGKGSPISPVDATRTSSTGIFNNSAVFSAIATAPRHPASPVHALALPELTTIAWAFPFLICSRLSLTGSAHTTFRVNTAAAEAG